MEGSKIKADLEDKKATFFQLNWLCHVAQMI